MAVALPEKITVAWLRRRGACERGIRDFVATFGESAAPTPENARKALAANLPLSWLASVMLNDAALRAFNDAARDANRRWCNSFLVPDNDADHYDASSSFGERTAAAYTAYQSVCAETLIRILWPDAVETPPPA